MERYTTIAGEVLEYEAPAPDVARFMARVVDATHDPGVTEADLTELIYGLENPILAQGILPTHGVVTRAVFEDPIYHVLTDLLGRKRVQMGTLDPELARDEYTVTISEAAARVGVHPSAIRQAVHAHKLDAIKKGKTWLLKPSSVETYAHGRRSSPRLEAPPAVVASVGNVPGMSLRIKVQGGELRETGREGKRIEGEIESFDRIAIISGDKARESYRYFELEPAEEEEELRFGPFYVRGRFAVVRKENNARKANAAWRAALENGTR